MANQQFKNRLLAEDHFTPEQRRDIVRLVEECGEVIQTCTKLLRFGPHNFSPFDPNKEQNIEAFRREVNDLLNCLEEMGELPNGYRRIVGALDSTL